MLMTCDNHLLGSFDNNDIVDEKFNQFEEV